MRGVVVTGVSSGIGLASARVLIANGFRVFGSVRDASDGERLKIELGETFTPLVFDVTDDDGVRRGAAEVAEAIGGETLAGLVNNAGIAKAGPLVFLPLGDFQEQLEVNLTGQLRVTQAFAPLLGVDTARTGKPGRIVMMSSVGGRNGQPFLGPYSASKFALEGLSESLRREMMVYRIEVVVIAPGPIDTPIWDKSQGIPTYDGTPYAEPMKKAKAMMIKMGKNGAEPEKVGSLVLEALTAKKPKMRYKIAGSAVQDALMAVAPKRQVDKVIAGALGLKSVR